MKELFDILNPFDNWENNAGDEKNLEAKQALSTFYIEIKKLKPDREYKNDFLHISYLNYLVRIRKAFIEQKYMLVCNEMISLMHYEPFFQGRIYYNVISLLEEGLRINENF